MQFCSSYHLAGASPLPLEVSYIFLVGSNILLLMAVQQQVVILEFSQEKMTTRPSTPPSLGLLEMVWELAKVIFQMPLLDFSNL